MRGKDTAKVSLKSSVLNQFRFTIPHNLTLASLMGSKPEILFDLNCLFGFSPKCDDKYFGKNKTYFTWKRFR